MIGNSQSNRKITVVGAGVVGMATALQLLQDGNPVTVIDRQAPGQGCSFGNAGILAPSYCIPLSMQGALWKVPGWLLDPMGPLAIRWRDFPSLVPWFLRFAAAGKSSELDRSARALRALHEHSVRDFQELFTAIGAADLVRPSGYLYAYETEAALAKGKAEWEIAKRYGVRAEAIDGGRLREMEPALSAQCVGGIHLPDDGQVTSPLAIVETMAEHFQRHGGVILRREIKDIGFGPEGPSHLVTDDEPLDIDRLVIAAGAWSGQLAARLGSRVPLVGERGYHVTLPTPGIRTRVPVMSGEGKFAMTPMSLGPGSEALRVAGTAEYASLEAPANYARARILLGHVKRMLPGIETEGFSEWMGMRPTLPDTLPVIGRSPRFASTYFAFGHSHAGLMGSVATGRAITDLIAGRTPGLDLAPFRADRFA